MTEDERLSRMDRRIESLEGKIDALDKTVGEIKTHGAVTDTISASIVSRLENIENSLRWVIRLVIGVLVLAAMSALIVSNGNVSFPPGV